MSATFKNYFKYTLVNSLYTAGVIVSCFSKNNFIYNITSFYTWLMFFASILALAATFISKDTQKNLLSIPGDTTYRRIFDRALDITLTLLWIGTGHFVLGSIYFVHMIFIIFVHEIVDNTLIEKI